MSNLIYETEQGILNLKKALKEVIDNREAIIEQIGIDAFKEKTGNAVTRISDMTELLLTNSLLN